MAEVAGSKAGTRITAVACVSDAFRSEHRSDRIRSLDSGDLAVCRAQQVPPLLDAVVSDQLHADYVVAAYEFRQLVVKWFSLMLSIELLAISKRHSGHLDVGDDEAGLLDQRDDLADVLIAVRLDHRESSRKQVLLFLLHFEPLPREDVCIVDDFELSRVHTQHRAQVEVFLLETGVLHLAQERPFVLRVPLWSCRTHHFDGFLFRIVAEDVGLDQ